MVNEYMEFSSVVVSEENVTELPLNNPYVEVEELVQTSKIIHIAPQTVSSIIFFFRKDDIVNGIFPCEGVEIAYFTRFRLVNGKLMVIPSMQCLPFTCSYVSYHLTVSYSKRIFDSLQLIRSTVTKSMCRKERNLGLSFISGSASFCFPKECWIFIANFCKDKGVIQYGPFKKKRKEFQMRNGLELNAISKEGSESFLQFATRAHFRTFDALFGDFSRYGFAVSNPIVGETSEAELNHFLFHMGNGIFPGSYEFKRRVNKNVQLGVDLRFDNMNNMLGISLRYKKERADENLTLSAHINSRKERYIQSRNTLPNSAQVQVYEHSNHELKTTIKEGVIFNLDGCTYRVLQNYNSRRSCGMCVVTSSTNGNDMIVNSQHNFDYNVIHRQVCLMIQSMFN